MCSTLSPLTIFIKFSIVDFFLSSHVIGGPQTFRHGGGEVAGKVATNKTEYYFRVVTFVAVNFKLVK